MPSTHTSDHVSALANPRWDITDRQRRAVDAALSDVTARSGSTLTGPITRVFRGGKRLRPALVLAVADRNSTSATDPAALAVSSAERLGKPVLADFANETITLPAVAAFRHHPELLEFARPDLSPSECASAVSLLREPQALAYATSCAVSHAERAGEILLSVARGRDRDALAALATWPLSYLAEQLDTKVAPSLRPLLDGAYSAVRRSA